MQIKGTAIKTTREFVRTNFPQSYESWLGSLPEETRKVYASSMLNMAGWYSMNDYYRIPMEKIVEMFYSGDVRTAGENLGSFSAEVALTGIYKLFLLVSSPNYLMTRATVVFSTYYVPSDIRVMESSSKSVTMHITRFPEMFPVLEYRIAGWCVKALELCSRKNIRYQITKSLLKGDAYTEIIYSWE